MSVIDNKLLVDESAFIDYMGKELRDFRERMGLLEKDKYRNDIGSSDFPLYVSENKEGLYIVVDYARIVGYRYDDWFKREKGDGNAVLDLLKEKGLERVVYYARCITAFYKDTDKDLDGTTFNYLRNKAKCILYVYLNYNRPQQTPHDVVKKQVVDIVRRLEGIKDGSYLLEGRYPSKRASRLRLPLKTLETEHKEYYFILSCESTDSECVLIQEHLYRKYGFQFGDMPLVEIACLLASRSVLKTILEIRVAIFKMLPDEEKIKMPLVEHVAAVAALGKINDVITLDGEDPLCDCILETYQMCLDLGMFKYSYAIDSVGK
nr:MAG TPA: hypothetical protein [Caudoviricetes sp.]